MLVNKYVRHEGKATYMIDYFQVLGIEKDATVEVIHTAYRQKQKQYHPDLFHGLAPEFQGRAKSMSLTINEAYLVLKDDQIRAQYLLDLNAWDGPISQRGEVVIDLRKSHFSLTSLLENMADGVQDQESENIALKISNFNKASYDYIESEYKSFLHLPQGVPPPLRQAYQEQLEARELYLALKEGVLWSNLGEMNRTTEGNLYHHDEARKALESTKAKADEHIREQVFFTHHWRAFTARARW
jgi:curved DNA-binding protein CbpA